MKNNKMAVQQLALVLGLWLVAGGSGVAGTFEQISFDTYHSEWNVNQGISPTGSNNMAISGDGRIVCFDDMTAGSTGLQCRDRATQTTEVISKRPDGTVAPGASPAISRDGRYVAYWRIASANMWDLNLYDRTNATTTLVAPGEGGNHWLYPPRPVSMSADGRYLVYGPQAHSTSYYPGQVDRGKIFDLLTGTKEDIRPYLPEEVRPYYGQSPPVLSGDGRYVAFTSYQPSSNQNAIYLLDRQTAILKNLSALGDLNAQYGGCVSYPSSISDDGQLVLLGTGCYPGWPLLYNNVDESFTNFCSTTAGEIGNTGCEDARLSGNGRLALFRTYSQNLLPDNKAGITGGWLVKFIDEGFLDWAVVDNEGSPLLTGWNHLSPNGDFIGFITYESLVKTDIPPPPRYWFDADHYIYDRSSVALKAATYSASKNELDVSVTSRLGEVAGLTLEGFGPMAFKSGTWSIKLNPANGNPGTVTVSGVEGRSTFKVNAR